VLQGRVRRQPRDDVRDRDLGRVEPSREQDQNAPDLLGFGQ